MSEQFVTGLVCKDTPRVWITWYFYSFQRICIKILTLKDDTKGLFLWETQQDKRCDGTLLFFSPLGNVFMRAVTRSKMGRENVFNWDKIITRDETVFVPLSWAWNSRSSPPWVFLRKGVLKIYSKFTGEHPSISVILIKLLCNFVEITHQHGCSPVNLLLFLEHLFLRTSLAECFWNRIIDFIIFIAGKSFE